MFKKLLSTMAAVAIMASALTGFTVASAETAKVTCNVTDGSTNTNTAAIVLEFDGAVDKADLEGKVTITKAGTSDECPITVEVNGTKAQLKINAPKVNTGYTLTVPADVTVGDRTLGTAFTRTFSTGTTLYTSSWSEIGTNADRLKNDSWSGTVTEVNNKNGNYLKFTGEKLIDYTLESEATDGILVIEYERYIPTKTTDANGDATETNTTFPRYGIYDKVFLDNTTKESAGFYTIDGNGNLKITKDNWHTYRYEIDLKNKNTKFYLDGTNKALDADPDYTDAKYAKTIKFQAGGGGTYNREMWIRNIKSYRTNELGKWTAGSKHKLTQSDGVTTITVPGTETTASLYTYYALTNPITDGKRVKISLEVNANDKLKDTPTSYGNNTSIRFDKVGGDIGGGTHAIWNPYKKPLYFTGDYEFFNIADSTNGLAANEWHTYECVFEFDKANDKRILKYVSVDGEGTKCSYEKTGASLGTIAFFVTNGTPDENDAVLKVRNINIESGDFEVTATNNELSSTANTIHLTFSSPVNSADMSALKVLKNGVDTGATITSTVAAGGYSADVTIEGLAETGNYELSFASLQDKYGSTSKTDKFDFTYTVSIPNTINITSATASVDTTDATKLNVTAVLLNGTDTAVSGKLIAAAYDTDTKRLLAVNYVDVADTELTSGKSDLEKTVQIDKPDGAYTVKVMLWRSLDSLLPICNCYTFAQ